ncbi:MAG TPA: type IV pilus biogenesis/stability protein PilW [Casimicrobiaceae bacterium]|jgi:type IV pilus assembly protein PilF
MPYRLLIIAFVSLLAACANNPFSGNPATTPPERPTRETPPPQQMASAHERARLHTDLGAGYYERGQMDIAISELNAALAIDSNYAPAYNIFGLVYAVLGEDRKAEQNFERALQLAPNDPDIHHNWGWYLCQHKRQREAIAQFELAVADPLYRTPETALVNAGRCAQAINDVRAAEGYFRRALAGQPANVLASYGLAQIAYKEGRYEEARAAMRRVMQNNNPPAEALRLGMCVERKLGDRQSELSYTSQLRNRYPDAPETKAIAEACE